MPVVVVVVVLRFGLYRVYRLKRSKASNSRPNQVKLGNSLIVVVNLEQGNVLPLRDSWVWFGLEQGNGLPLRRSWVWFGLEQGNGLPLRGSWVWFGLEQYQFALRYSWVFVWFRYRFSIVVVLSIVWSGSGNVFPFEWVLILDLVNCMTRSHLHYGYNCT